MLLKYILLLSAFIVSLVSTSLLIRKGIPLLKKPVTPMKQLPVWYLDLGFWIGFFEHLIIFVFVLNQEFSALAIIFGTKEFVRKEEIQKHPEYYLLGTLINFGIALIWVEITKEILKNFCIGQ